MSELLDDARPAISAAIIVNEGRLLLARRRVSEGQLSWQFPAGEVEPEESPEEAAVRETLEEVGLVVESIRTLGQRIHPATGRTMVYVACGVVSGEARVADADELAEVEWCGPAEIADHVPYPFYEPVQDYITASVS
jgi:8-oxo-dGTP diphosphatase